MAPFIPLERRGPMPRLLFKTGNDHARPRLQAYFAPPGATIGQPPSPSGRNARSGGIVDTSV